MVAQIEKFLALARKITSGKMILPILEQICFRDGKMIATDLDNTLVMDSGIKESFTISHKLLMKIMKQKPHDITVKVDDTKVHLSYDDKQLQFRSMPVDGFPEVPGNVDTRIGGWDRSLVKHFHSQRPYVSTDELKPALTGVYIQSNGSLESCSTNGHMMRVLKMVSCGDRKYEMILRPKTLDLIYAGSRNAVKVFESDSHYRFSLSPGLDLLVRKMDEKYPDYNHVIPKECPERVSFSHRDFLQLIKSSKPFVSRKSKRIEVKVKDNRLMVCVTDMDEEIRWNGDIPIESMAGKDCHFGFEIGYLEKIISGINTDQLTWKHNGGVSASIFSGDTRDDVEQMNLLMPVRLERNEDEE